MRSILSLPSRVVKSDRTDPVTSLPTWISVVGKTENCPLGHARCFYLAIGPSGRIFHCQIISHVTVLPEVVINFRFPLDIFILKRWCRSPYSSLKSSLFPPSQSPAFENFLLIRSVNQVPIGRERRSFHFVFVSSFFLFNTQVPRRHHSYQ